MASRSASEGGREPLDALLDLLVYAPIGLVLDAETVAPDLAKRGRQHTANARHLGELAVKAGLKRLEGAVAQARCADDEAPTTRRDRATDESLASDDATDDEPETEDEAADRAEDRADLDLPIADYDALAASQIVKRLDGLTPDQLESVREYESANRGRRTILSKLARLQS